MAGGTYTLICMGLTVAVLVAMLAPPPAQAVEAEAQISPVLLVAAVAAVLLMGALALSDQHVAAVLCGGFASLVVVPCLWLARAPEPAGGWDEWADEDDDDDGGSPRPSSPFTPPAPDEDLPGHDPSGDAGAYGTSLPAAAFTFTPSPVAAQAALPAWALRADSPAWASAEVPQFVAPAPDLYEELPLDETAWELTPVTPPICDEDDAAAVERRGRRPVARRRGEHRSVAHVRARRGVHHGRRPASLPRRVVRACRRLLGVESPERRLRSREAALEHGGRRHALRLGSRSAEARRDTVSR